MVNKIFLLDIFSLFAASSVDMCFVINDPTVRMLPLQMKAQVLRLWSLCWESGLKCYVQWSPKCTTEINNAVYIRCLICITFYKLKFEKILKL